MRASGKGTANISVVELGKLIGTDKGNVSRALYQLETRNIIWTLGRKKRTYVYKVNLDYNTWELR